MGFHGSYIEPPDDYDWPEVSGSAQADTLPLDKTELDRIKKAERRRKRDGIGFTAKRTKAKTKGKGKT